MKFKLKAIAVDFYEDEIEAKDEEEAKLIMKDKFENAELFSETGTDLFFDGEEEFEALNEMFIEEE